jgi:hypothetical protein
MFLTQVGAWSQKKAIDTIYVYEEVIIHDTIYIEKPLHNLTIENAMLMLTEMNTGILTFGNNGEHTTINLNHLTLKDSTNQPKKQIKTKPKREISDWSFGVKTIYNQSFSNLFTNSKTISSNGYGLGITVMKRLFRKNGYLSAGVNYNRFPKSTTVTKENTSSPFNGFYFYNNLPNLFLETSNKYDQIQVPILAHYRIGNFIPSIGLVYTLNTYDGATFLSSSGNAPLTFDQTTTTKMKTQSLGGIIEMGYCINTHFYTALNFTYSKTNEIIFYENSSELFSLKKDSAQRQLSLSITYFLNTKTKNRNLAVDK